MDHFIENHDKSIVAGFTIVLAISTIGLWLSTSALQRTTNALWTAGEKQIELTRISAEAAQKSAEFTEKSFRHTHMPSISYRITELPKLVANTIPVVAIELMNSGGAVYDGAMQLGFELISSEEFSAPIKIKKPKRQGFTWERNDAAALRRAFSRKLTADDIHEILAERKGLNYWGYLAGDNAWSDPFAGTFSYIFTGDFSDAKFASREIEIEEADEEKDKD